MKYNVGFDFEIVIFILIVCQLFYTFYVEFYS